MTTSDGKMQQMPPQANAHVGITCPLPRAPRGTRRSGMLLPKVHNLRPVKRHHRTMRIEGHRTGLQRRQGQEVWRPRRYLGVEVTKQIKPPNAAGALGCTPRRRRSGVCRCVSELHHRPPPALVTAPRSPLLRLGEAGGGRLIWEHHTISANLLQA